MSSFLGGSGSPAEWVWSVFVLVGTVVLFVAGWRILSRLAARHADADPRARGKVLVATAIGLALAAGGFVMLSNFEAQSVVGIHATFVKAVNQTVGEGDYLDATKTQASRPAALAIQQGNLAHARAEVAAGNASAQKDVDANLNATKQTQKDWAAANLTVKLLTPNHQVWLQVAPHLAAGTDAEDEVAHGILLKALNASAITTILPANVACARDPATGDCDGSGKAAAIQHSFRDLHTLSDVPVSQGVPEAFEHKEQFRAQMQSMLAWFVYPGLAGLALAPFAFAGGSILNAAYEPSDTVGYKPYPGKAAGFFLLLGGFGLFAIPFAAWTLRDLSKRSAEGQIAL